MEEDTMDIWKMIQEVEDHEERAILWKLYTGELRFCKSCEETLIPRALSQVCDPCKEASVERKRERDREYKQRPEVKARRRERGREYRQRPEVKARTREYMREYMREYQKRPEVKAWRRKYEQRPEVKARAREYQQRKKAQEEE